MTVSRLLRTTMVTGAVGVLLLVVAEFTRLYAIESRGRVVASGSAGAHHGYALLVIGLGAAVLLVPALRPDSPRYLGLAVLVLGLAAVLVVVAIDLPDLGQAGSFGEVARPATSTVGLGFFLESAGAVLLLLTGGLRIAAPRG